MRVFSVGLGSHYVAKSSNLNYTGLLVKQSSNSYHDEYDGIPSGSSYDGHYSNYDDEDRYIYYPFKDESEKDIERVLNDNNYYSSYASYGYGGGQTVSTSRGKTLPYTKSEWNRLAKSIKENILKIL